MSLDELNKKLRTQRFTPGWNKTTPSLWKEPRTDYRPNYWSYEVAKASLDRAGDLISTDLAERRNLLMFDEADGNEYATTRTLVVAYQMLKPGEHARAHRHSPNALRLVLESGEDVATVVDGVEIPMREGSVLLTPGGCWHSHFNNGSGNSYWIDILDVPLVHQLEPMFFDPFPEEYQKSESRPERHDFAFFADDIEQRLSSAKERDGVRIAELPAPSMRTVSLTVIEFLRDADLSFQETSNNIFAVMSGAGEFGSSEASRDWSFGDVFSIPMWAKCTISGKKGAKLLRVSDQPVMEMLGLFRKGPHAI